MYPIKLILLLSSVFAFSAHAQFVNHNDYVGGGIVRTDLALAEENFDLNAIDLRLGVEMQKWLHVEGRVAFGINDKSAQGVEVSINRLINLNAIVSLPNKSIVSPYALIGVTYGELDLLVPGIIRGEESETDLSFGAGLNISAFDSFDIYLEYMQYIDKNFIDLSGIGVGVKFGF